MGRPLNKKYFGNRNIGANGYEITQHGSQSQYIINGDDAIGGEGVFGAVFTPTPIANSVYTSGAYLDKMPHITAIDAPTIANGVQAVADVTNVEAVFAVPNNKGTGYQIGDIVEGTTGTGTKARFRVTQLRVLTATLSDAANSQAFDGGENLVWDSGVDSHWTSPTILTNVSSTGSPNYDISGWASFVGGVWDGTDGTHAPTTALTITGGNNTPNAVNPSYNTRGTGDLRGKVGLPNRDNNGYGGKVTFTYGIEAVEVIADYQGNYTAVDAAAQAVANITVGATGANATLDIFYGVKTITVTQKGSGYTGVETITFTAPNNGQSETRAVGTVALTEDTGAVGSATNQENAIIAYAVIDGLEEVDIASQVSTNRYKINSGATGNQDKAYFIGRLKYTGVASTQLGNRGDVYETEMNIWAFDADGNSYLVKKLTAHKAVVYPMYYPRLDTDPGTLFAAGQSVPWKFFEGQTYADAGYVKIENA